jgi:hypothetical protein
MQLSLPHRYVVSAIDLHDICVVSAFGARLHRMMWISNVTAGIAVAIIRVHDFGRSYIALASGSVSEVSRD